MKKYIFLFCVVLIVVTLNNMTVFAAEKELVEFVNPFIGT